MKYVISLLTDKRNALKSYVKTYEKFKGDNFINEAKSEILELTKAIKILKSNNN